MRPRGSRSALLALMILAVLPGKVTGQTATLTGRVRLPDAVPADAVIALLPLDSAGPFTTTDTVLIDQHELRFLPSVLAVAPGTTVLFRNSDPVLHNVFSPKGPGEGFNLGTYPSPGIVARRFDIEGVHVILCHVHPEMVAYATVVPTPYRLITDAEGEFTMTGLPPGRYLARVWWRRRLRAEQVITLGAGQRLVVELGPGRRAGASRP